VLHAQQHFHLAAVAAHKLGGLGDDLQRSAGGHTQWPPELGGLQDSERQRCEQTSALPVAMLPPFPSA
jgi:hypothetical protein